jgi:PAS domain S-box-containing protein
MKTNVLIVEDEGLIALDLKKKLERAGYGVSGIADSATEALAAIAEMGPDLVMMDIRIRGPQDGIETADEIRQRFHIPVIFVTAHADDDTLERARITEPFGYIVKPFHRMDFRPQIEMALWKHRMEQKLRESEAWLAAAIGNVADALIATDREGNIALMNANAAELTGWDCAEAKGRPLLEVFETFEETTGLPVVHPLDAVYDGREVEPGSREYRLTRRGGGNVCIEAEMSANRDHGLLLGAIIVFRDITARRQAEAETRLLQTQNALTLMAVGLGRELEAFQRRIDDIVNELVARTKGDTLRQLLEIYDVGAHQKSVIQQLILLGEKPQGTPSMVDAGATIRGLEVEFREELGPRCPLLMTLEPDLPPISVDEEGLRQALLRLVVEGREAMPDDGSVEIATSTVHETSGSQSVRLTVRDSGSRLRPGAGDRIFDPYYQARIGNRNPGFSLALVHRFVVLSGGKVEVENTEVENSGVESFPHGGVRFTLTFPAARFPDRAAGASWAFADLAASA